jgi:cytochrome c biogenesis protein CcmG, thiol:disulfide interchange protein DsbE
MLRNATTVTCAVSRAGTKRNLLPILTALAGAGLLALLIYGVAAQSASRTLDQRVADGHYPAAPDSQRALAQLEGSGRASLASFKGQVVVLNFWASWCEPCRAEAPLLERTQRGLEGHGGTVLGVSYLDASPDSAGFVRRYRLTYPQLRDGDGSFARAYGTNQLPETFVIDRAGHIVAISRGELSARFLDRALARARSS